MFNSANVPSLADIAAVTGNNKNDGMWGGDGWWAIIIFAIIFGWNGFGNNGWGGNGGSIGATAAAYTDSAIQRGFDTQSIIGKLDGINNGFINFINSLCFRTFVIDIVMSVPILVNL